MQTPFLRKVSCKVLKYHHVGESQSSSTPGQDESQRTVQHYGCIGGCSFYNIGLVKIPADLAEHRGGKSKVREQCIYFLIYIYFYLNNGGHTRTQYSRTERDLLSITAGTGEDLDR